MIAANRLTKQARLKRPGCFVAIRGAWPLRRLPRSLRTDSDIEVEARLFQKSTTMRSAEKMQCALLRTHAAGRFINSDRDRLVARIAPRSGLPGTPHFRKFGLQPGAASGMQVDADEDMETSTEDPAKSLDADRSASAPKQSQLRP